MPGRESFPAVDAAAGWLLDSCPASFRRREFIAMLGFSVRASQSRCLGQLPGAGPLLCLLRIPCQSRGSIQASPLLAPAWFLSKPDP